MFVDHHKISISMMRALKCPMGAAVLLFLAF
jgi:hypothetical protein